MKIQKKVKSYTSNQVYSVIIEIENNQLVKGSCTCIWGSHYGQLEHNQGNLCKHIKEVWDGEVAKPKVKFQEGYATCPNWLRDAFRKSVKYVCQECHQHEDEVGKLEIHRIIRGGKGGLYIPQNIKCVCIECHNKYHPRNIK